KVHNERTRIARTSLRNPNAESGSPFQSNPGVLSESTHRIDPEHLNAPKRLRNPEPLNESLITSEPINAEPINAEPINAEPINAEPINAEPINAEPVHAEPINASTELRELIMDIHRRRYSPSAIHSATD